MTCSCRHRTSEFQPFPTRGVLSQGIDLQFSILRKKTQNCIHEPVYAYVVKSVQNVDRQLRQMGSAPNFQGERITLCTCKHKDRASAPKYQRPDANDPWQDMWVAGITSVAECRPPTLFYLMRVATSYSSHRAMWRALPDPEAKSAHRHIHGDIYEPSPDDEEDEYNTTSYRPHLHNHVHDMEDMKKDIQATYWGRHPWLLQGDPALSFLWSQPQIKLEQDNDWGTAHHRFYQTLQGFFETLR